MKLSTTLPTPGNEKAAVVSSGDSKRNKTEQTRAEVETTNLPLAVNTRVKINARVRPADPFFFPMWLNEAGLNRGEFRIYYAIACRCNFKTGVAWPSVETIARDCGYRRTQTIWPYLESLIDKGLIERIPRPGTSNCYRASRGFTQCENRTTTQCDNRTTHPVRKPHHECREGNVEKEVCVGAPPPAPNHTHTQSFSPTPDQTTEALKEYHLTSEEREQCLKKFIRYKTPRYKDELTFGHFQDFWTYPEGKDFIAKLRKARVQVAPAPVGLVEPVGWRDEFPGSQHAQTPWERLSRLEQGSIIEAMAKARLKAMAVA